MSAASDSSQASARFGMTPRTGPYAHLTDEQMQGVRRDEQRKAAVLGRYAIQLQIAHPSSVVKTPGHAGVACRTTCRTGSAAFPDSGPVSDGSARLQAAGVPLEKLSPGSSFPSAKPTSAPIRPGTSGGLITTLLGRRKLGRAPLAHRWREM